MRVCVRARVRVRACVYARVDVKKDGRTEDTRGKW